MRILNVSAQKPDSTGSGVYLAETVRCELALGHEAAVVCGIDAADAPALPPAARLFPVRFNTPELPFAVAGMSDEMPYAATRYRDFTPETTAAFTQAFAARVREACAAFHPDAIVCHHLYLVTALVRECAPDLPVHAICHSTELRQMASHGLERDRILRGVRALDGVFALHEAQAAAIVEEYACDPARIRVLGTGYDARLFKRAPRAEREGAVEGAAAPLRLLYVGKIWEKKGVGCLLEAFDRFDPGPREATLTLVGGHNDEEEHRRFVERAAACRRPVEFAGRLTPEELAPRYQQADVFVLPSFFEGLPLVVVEALACGCRVVVSDLPGIRPWLTASAPDAPVVYVPPARMLSLDEPDPADLPAFAARIARALEEAAELPPCTTDLTPLSWEGLTRRLVAFLEASTV